MAKDYYDILNRKKPIDRVADAYTTAADQMRPINNAQRQEANMLRGFGAGLGMSGDFVREQKLKEVEEQAKQASQLNHELTMSMGQNKLRQEKLTGFYNNYRSDLKMANDYLKEGDYDALDMLIPTLASGYEKATGNKTGKFVKSYNGVVTFDMEGGNYQTISIKDMMNPLMDVIPENDRGNYDAFMNTYQKKDFDMMRQSKEAALQHAYVQIAHLRAQANQANQHANVYKQEADPNSLINRDKLAKIENTEASTDKIRRETDFIGKDKTNVDKVFQSNVKFLEDYHTQFNNKKAFLEAYKGLGDLFTEENKSLFNRSGVALITKAQRAINFSLSDSARRQALIEMKKEPLYRQIKDIFVGVVSDNDMALFVSTLPDLSKPYKANEAIINERIANLENDLFKLETTRKMLEESGYNTHYTHSSIQDNVEKLNNERIKKETDEKEKIELEKQNKVKLKLKDDTVKIYDKTKDDKAIKELLDNNLADKI